MKHKRRKNSCYYLYFPVIVGNELVARPPRLFRLEKPPRWLSGKASACSAGDPEIKPLFYRSSHTTVFKDWYSSGYPARRLAFQGQCWDWLAHVSVLLLGLSEIAKLFSEYSGFLPSFIGLMGQPIKLS